MFKIISAAGLAVLVCGINWSQTPLSFEVASIKPSAPCCAAGQWRESKAGLDRIDFPFGTLRYCIAFAYRVKEYQVTGPAWLGTLRYNIVAKGPDGTTHDQLPAMMQALLAERFKLQIHHEQKDFNVFVMAVGKDGLKLKESPPEAGESRTGANFGMSMSATGVGRLEARGADMPTLATTLARMLGTPVIDMTGVSGRYDFALEFTHDDSSAMIPRVAPAGGSAPSTPDPGASIFMSLRQIGLKLDAQKRPLDSIVVDRVEKDFTEN